jgi:hypothetical protein
LLWAGFSRSWASLTLPPRVVLARGPPLREMPDAAPTECELQAHSAQECEFDQRIA